MLRPAEAGRDGEDVRSDLHVAIEPRTEGGLGLELRSRVLGMYGDSIRSGAMAVLEAMGVRHARVVMDDRGALPWVIAARVEAAARRAGYEPDRADPRPARTVTPGPASPRDRLRRSRMYLPGNEPKFMLNAGLHGADAVIFDLEDSVHPDHKDSARVVVRNALRCLDLGATERMVRINPLPLGMEDLEEIVPEAPDLILVPKAEDPGELRAVAEVVEGLRARPGSVDPHRPVWLMPIVETALGVENAFALARCTPLVAALTIGLEDYTADLGVAKTPLGEESAWARRRIVNAARAAGVQPIDSVYGDVGDDEGLAAWAREARGLGFVGMGCVHPRQIQPVHRAFAPTAEELARARRIVSAFEEAEARGSSVVSLGSRMIDPPVVLRARRLVELAGAMGIPAAGEDP